MLRLYVLLGLFVFLSRSQKQSMSLATQHTILCLQPASSCDMLVSSAIKVAKLDYHRNGKSHQRLMQLWAA